MNNPQNFCPYCKEEISPESQFCPHCGKQLHRCAGCGTPLPDYVRFCPACGRPTQQSSQTVQSAPHGKGSSSKVILLVILVLLVLCISIAAGIMLRNFTSGRNSVSDEENQPIPSQTEPADGQNETPPDEPAQKETESPEENTMTDIEALAREHADDVIVYGDHAYAIFSTKEHDLMSYNECEQFCEKMEGHLAVIDSYTENELLYQFVLDSDLKLAFFGYSDQDSEGDWKWVTGDSTYTNWDSGQPNNGAKNNNDSEENYAEFSRNAADGTWNDAPFAANTYHFICEWE